MPSGRRGGKRKGRRGSRGAGHSSTRRKTPSAAFPTGTISITSEGYGFVETSDGKFFIPARRINGAMDGDTVRVRPSSSGGGRDGSGASDGSRRFGSRAPIATVDRVLHRAHSTIVGMYILLDGIGFVIPQDARMDYLIRARTTESVCPGESDIVMLAMETYPSRRESPSGVVVRILGREGDPGIAEEIIAARHGLETAFSQGAIEEAGELRLDIDSALQEPDRRDLRDRFILTIDPADAKDFDDALSLEHVDGLVRLGVHIADVSHYVRWGTSLDLDARRRATSTYFPDRVIPMLPERLSNGLCSLNPDEERLAFTVDIYLDGSCKVVRSEMYPSVIRSRLRLDYGHVQEMFDGGCPYPSEEARGVLDGLHRVSRKLFARRIARGALDFESSELKIVFSDSGEPIDIVKRTRNDATDLVEEAMILANETVASFMLDAGSPMVYRVHDEPSPSSLEEVVPVLRELGVLKGSLAPTNRSIQSVLDSVRGKPVSEIVNGMLLRAMKQAVYRDGFTTHFGLASTGYTHFTSPIRRYPDLIAHRFLRYRLFEAARDRGEIPRSEPLPSAVVGIGQMADQLQQLCEHSSAMEREAEKASYEALERRICEYMEGFVGQTFDAMIVNVLSFGFFVRITNGCEGLVSVRSLDGWYSFDETKRVLTDLDSPRGRTFGLGQRVRVVLISTGSAGSRARLAFRLA